MIHYLLIFSAVIVTSLYYFPFEFIKFPGVNTKMAMAAVGLVVCLYHLIQKKEFKISKDFFVLSSISIGISLMAYFSVVYNSTPDYSYVTYFISMWVWMSAAFVVCKLIKKVHGSLSVELLCNYLVVVCVSQCILALLIDYLPSFKNVIDANINQAQGFLNEVNRLYGIGASLDVAGTRFSVCLIMIVFISFKQRYELTTYKIWLYVISYIFIAVIGNMIARTTTVGVVISMSYLFFMQMSRKLEIKTKSIKLWINVFSILVIAVPIVIFFYNSNMQFRTLFQYGFEGFFNYFDGGTWETASTNVLKTMYVFPESLKTWIIGDGYYVNPFRIDPNYVGEKVYFAGYYMLTDVGYLRFIFYFGLIGLAGFITLFVAIAKYIINKAPQYKYLFLMLLLANFTIWLKVSTDIFLVFALLFCLTNMMEKEGDSCLNNENSL